ncbi:MULTISPECIES: zinc-dependent alcohol dehydrogenase family protein [unclassified Bradyrhizobium]|uniref:zinc-dependent alcohol dehydrogenase family protein n=1 Tax=unclassified Bradyrhizobium TaxID=2631580 RepID=UPI0028E9FFEF|nr:MULTISPECIES: zinc-dependent alcohol dehydrogenase family protein [unclassified Bradyrhizobium]
MAFNQSMRAVVLDEVDGPFRIAEVPRPSPGPGEVLVRVAASGLNPLDLKIRAGKAAHARHPLPAVLGIDLAGTVERVGSGVTGFKAGDEVYGMTGGVGGIQGSLAEFAAVDARLIAHKPTRLGMREAAALPLITITAWEGLVDRAAISRGQTVLVQGGGGVGRVAAQLARARGAEVFVVASAERRAELSALGVTPIDRHTTSVDQYVREYAAGRGFDVVYDTAGGAALDASFHAVARFGHVVSALGWGSHALAPLSFKAASYSGVFTLLPLLTGEGREHHGFILAQAAKLADAGHLAPRMDERRFSRSEVDAAYAALAGGATGKIVVELE